MPAQNPTVITTSLDDSKLRNSIQKLVTFVKEQTEEMATSFDTSIHKMEQTMARFSSGGISANVKEISESFKQLTASINNVTEKQGKRGARQIAESYDQIASAMSKATVRENIFQAFDQQIENFVQRLRQVRGDIEAAKGLIASGDSFGIAFGRDELRKSNEEAERLMATIQHLERQKANLADVMSPQGDTIRNFVQDLQRANPELQKLNEQYRQGNTLLKQQAQSLSQSTTATTQNAQALQKVAMTTQGVSFTTNEMQRLANAVGMSEKELQAFLSSSKVSTQTLQDLKSMLNATGSDFDSAYNRVSLFIKALESMSGKIKDMASIRANLATDVSLSTMSGGSIPTERLDMYAKALGITRGELDKLIIKLQEERAAENSASTSRTKSFQDFTRLQQAVDFVNQSLKRKITITNSANSSYNKLSQTLQYLQTAYHQLTSAERNSDMGQSLIRNIQLVSRHLQQLQNQMNRPTDRRSVFGLDESTLDNIAYKIRQLSSYRSGLNVETQKKEIGDVTKAMNELEKKQRELIGMNNNLINSNNALARSWNYMKNRLAFYFTVGASTQFVKNLIDVRSQYEMLERSMGILINSAEKGTQIFRQLSDMALVSPYTLVELGTAAKQLVAYDVAAKDVVDTTRRLADMAAAVGIPIDRLTYALGQIKAYGYLNARDARMFSNAGIPLVKQLSEHYTELEGRMVSVSDVYDRIKKKMIGYNEVMTVINRMTDEGGKFFDYQAKMAETLKVQLANLNLAWNNMLNSIGESNQGILSWFIRGLKEVFLQWKNINRVAISAGIAFGLLKLTQFVNSWRQVGLALAAVDTAGLKLTRMLTGLGNALKAVATNPWTWVFVVLAAIVDAIHSLHNANQAVKDFNNSIREGAEEARNSLDKMLDSYKDWYELSTSQKDGSWRRVDAKYIGTKDVQEQVKAWQSVREELETTTASSKYFIGDLVKITDLSERLGKAFKIAAELRDARGALTDISEKAIQAPQEWSAWWNLWMANDGLIENAKDYQKELNNIVSLYGSVENAEKAMYSASDEVAKDAQESINAYRTDLKQLEDDIRAFTSTLNSTFTSLHLNPLQTREAFEFALNKEFEGKGLDPKTELQTRIQIEEQFIEQRRKAYEKEISDRLRMARSATSTEMQERYQAEAQQYAMSFAMFQNQFGQNQTLVTGFYDWLKSHHAAELQSLFGNMTQEEINHIDWSEPQWQEWAKKNAQAFSDQYGISFDKLWAMVKEANTWQVHIGVVLDSTNLQKSVLQQLNEADAKVAKARGEIDRLTEGLNGTALTLDQRIQAINEREQAQKDYNKGIAAGGRDKQAEKDARKADANARKRASAAAKAQKTAEQEVASALKDELSIIKEIQSNYEKMRKAGISDTDAVNLAARGYELTLQRVNNVLSKYGINKFNASDFSGKNVKQILDTLERQRDSLLASGKVKRSGLKDLEVEIEKLTIDAKAYDMKKITDGLNSELSKIKDEYEIAVELDSSPELGEMLASAFNLDISDFPKTAEEAIQRLQDAADKSIQEVVKSDVKIDGSGMLESFDILRDDIQEWAKNAGRDINSELIQALENYQKEAKDIFKKDATDTINEWQKLIEKYAEYEYRKSEIMRKAEHERQIARKRNASQEVMDAINEREKYELAQLNFTEFQKKPDWALATGSLNALSDKALGMLIARLEQYKKSAKNLTPKQINEVNKALRNLRKEMRKNDPFSAIANTMDEARANGELFNEEIARVDSQIQRYMSNYDSLANEEKDRLQWLIKYYNYLIELQEEASKPSFQNVMKDVGTWVGGLQELSKSLKEMAEASGDEGFIEAMDYVSDMLGNFAAAEKGAETWGGWWGAIIGGVIDAIPKIMKYIGQEKEIDKQMNNLTDSIKKLQIEYKRLEFAVEDAYGAAEIGAKRASLANKEAQLTNLKSQLALEKSRKKKNQDKELISELENNIIDLEREIVEGARDITNALLGISSVGEAAENLVSSMISAFRNGEDYMASYANSFEDMIDTMVMKAIVGRVIGDKIQKMFDYIDTMQNSGMSNEAYLAEQERLRKEIDAREQALQSLLSMKDSTPTIDFDALYGQTVNELRSQLQVFYAQMAELQAKQSDVLTPENVEAMRSMYQGWQDDVKSEFDMYMEMFGIRFGDRNEAQSLSALQQGIQGITEDTAGALEAYMNGVSQQVYLHSDLLTQIRDAVVLLNTDVALATNSQMLLQLQQSYQMQAAIQAILIGWSNAAGSAVQVELLN